MNQILDHNPRRNGNSGGSNKNLFKIFAVVLLIFAVVLIGNGIYSMFKENEQKNPISKENNNTEEIKAIVKVEVDGSTAKIKVEHDKEIDKVIYKWNDGSEKTTSANKKTSFEKIIDIPRGENTLYVTVIDVDKVETTYEQQITAEEGIDIEIPKIQTTITEDKKLKITATDDIGLDFITYRWNEEEEKKIKADQPDQKKIEIIIEIPKDTNELIIVAVDTSNNTATYGPIPFAGLTIPTIEAGIIDEKNLLITVEHEKGIEKIEYTIYNGDPNDADTESKYYTITDQHGTKVEFTQALFVGYNRIIIKAVSLDNTVKKFDGECNYNPNKATNNSNTNTNTNTNTTSNTTNNTNTTNTQTTENTTR